MNDKSRQIANIKLASLLGELVLKYPDQRFSQLLRNYMFVRERRPVNPETGVDWANEFYMDSDDLWKRVAKSLENN